MKFIKRHKMLFNVLFFLLIAGLTAYALFWGNDINALINGLKQTSPFWILACVAAAVLFIGIESVILATMLKKENRALPIASCVKYALIGYFYSSITPSATGGQPAQLYYMVKDGHKSSRGTVALLAMAFYYKLVMVGFGVLLMIFWLPEIQRLFGNYIWVYYLGLFLNTCVLAAILCFMFIPRPTRWIIVKCERLLIKLRILKESAERPEKIDAFLEQYKKAVEHLFDNKLQVLLLTLLTFIQRSLLMIMPVFIYFGLPLDHSDALSIFFIQAAMYVAVDMLPVPGAQGVTEIIFVQTLGTIFTTAYTTASMVLTRGISFYIILLAGLVAVVLCSGLVKSKHKKGEIVNEAV